MNDPQHIKDMVNRIQCYYECMEKITYSYEEARQAWLDWSKAQTGGWMKVVPYVELPHNLSYAELDKFLPIRMSEFILPPPSYPYSLLPNNVNDW